jgi:ATP-dependent protease HslVU (ClpYQ) ATPase subunit
MSFLTPKEIVSELDKYIIGRIRRSVSVAVAYSATATGAASSMRRCARR